MITKKKELSFSDEMIEAILERRKTMTRQIVTPMKSQDWLKISDLAKCPSAYMFMADGLYGAQFQHPLAGSLHEGVWNKYNSPYTCIECPYGKIGDTVKIRVKNYGIITLEIMNVSIERVQDIKDWDAEAEGLEIVPALPSEIKPLYKNYTISGGIFNSPINSFQSWWEWENGIGSWGMNPWVWAIRFRLVY